MPPLGVRAAQVGGIGLPSTHSRPASPSRSSMNTPLRCPVSRPTLCRPSANHSRMVSGSVVAALGQSGREGTLPPGCTGRTQRPSSAYLTAASHVVIVHPPGSPAQCFSYQFL